MIASVSLLLAFFALFTPSSNVHCAPMDSSGIANPMERSSTIRHFWLDTDIGGDIDDLFALNMLLQTPSIKLVGVSTVNNNPIQKAQIAGLALKHSSVEYASSVEVYPGIGSSEGDNEQFLKNNPAWPKMMFGLPKSVGQYKEMYNRQGEAYKILLENHIGHSSGSDGTAFQGSSGKIDCDNCESKQVDSSNAVDAMCSAVSKAAEEGKKLEIVSIGPLNNIAALLEQCDGVRDHIVVYHMGGWFAHNDGRVKRAGYNSGISPASSQSVFNSGVDMVVVSSDIVDKAKIEISEEEWISLIQNANKKSEWALAVRKDWENWHAVFSRIHFADVFTTYLALYPEQINKAVGYKVTFDVRKHHDEYNPKGFMAVDEAAIVTAVPDEKSSVKVVTEVMNSQAALDKILLVVKEVLQQD